MTNEMKRLARKLAKEGRTEEYIARMCGCSLATAKQYVKQFGTTRNSAHD